MQYPKLPIDSSRERGRGLRPMLFCIAAQDLWEVVADSCFVPVMRLCVSALVRSVVCFLITVGAGASGSDNGPRTSSSLGVQAHEVWAIAAKEVDGITIPGAGAVGGSCALD